MWISKTRKPANFMIIHCKTWPKCDCHRANNNLANKRWKHLTATWLRAASKACSFYLYMGLKKVHGRLTDQVSVEKTPQEKDMKGRGG